MRLIFARHDRADSKEFLFSVPEKLNPRKGDLLLVNTMRGEALATATSEVFAGSDMSEVALRLGAYFPLKEVVCFADALMVDWIENRERNRIAQQITQTGAEDVPF